jgi:hypothetical protein
LQPSFKGRLRHSGLLIGKRFKALLGSGKRGRKKDESGALTSDKAKNQADK